jgi:cell wall-associated NlpC family hydrolase
MPVVNSPFAAMNSMSAGDTGARRTTPSPMAAASAKSVSFGQILADKRRSLGAPATSTLPFTARPTNSAASPAAPKSASHTAAPVGTPAPFSAGALGANKITRGSAAATAAAARAAAAPTIAAKTSASLPLSNGALTLDKYPRPADDEGRGIHWVPTVSQPKETVDRFVKEADDMGVSWVTFLNGGTQIGDNDYLVEQLGKRGIMPVMRVYTANGSPIEGDLGAMVRHYAAKGVPYFQLYNEPNLSDENNGKKPDVNAYLDKWTPAARTVVENGGLPGFGALAPGADYDDLKFLRESVQGLKQRGQASALDRAWLSIHNYMFNRPAEYTGDSNGFLKFRAYDQILKEELGRTLPMIGTEGGAMVGWNQDPSYPTVDRNRQADLIQDAFRYMGEKREPYNLAYSVWNIANKDGGAFDPSFEKGALFTAGTASPAVAAIKALGAPAASAPVSSPSLGATPSAQSRLTTEANSQARSLGETTLATAQKFLGSKYVWGGHSPAGFDCTGFTWYVGQQVGLKIPQHDLQGQMKSGPRIQKADLKAGDLVFFQNTYQAGLSHVGIATGDGRFVHAASEKLGVMTSKLDDPYWAQRYVGATRPTSSDAGSAGARPAASASSAGTRAPLRPAAIQPRTPSIRSGGLPARLPQQPRAAAR